MCEEREDDEYDFMSEQVEDKKILSYLTGWKMLEKVSWVHSWKMTDMFSCVDRWKMMDMS
jgi:hypothetical protein